MNEVEDEFAGYVEHPRFGRGPRYTSAIPRRNGLVNFLTKWYRGWRNEIPNTGIVADQEKQHAHAYVVPYYFDKKCVCRDCKRPFIFFAEEQKHWYEDLGFYIWARCVRCVDCRKKGQLVRKAHKRYQELIQQSDCTPSEHLELAEYCIAQMESGDMRPQRCDYVRSLLKKAGYEQEHQGKIKQIKVRLQKFDEVTHPSRKSTTES